MTSFYIHFIIKLKQLSHLISRAPSLTVQILQETLSVPWAVPWTPSKSAKSGEFRPQLRELISREVGAFCSDFLRNGKRRDRHKSYHANSTKSVPLVNVPLHPFKFIPLKNKWDDGKSNGFANNSRYNSDFDFHPNKSNSISIVPWLRHLSVHL